MAMIKISPQQCVALMCESDHINDGIAVILGTTVLELLTIQSPDSPVMHHALVIQSEAEERLGWSEVALKCAGNNDTIREAWLFSSQHDALTWFMAHASVTSLKEL